MKKRAIKAGVLILVFIAALVISSIVINSGTDDEIVDMGAPTLPRVSFTVGGTEVNPLFGYVQDMDITAMRDTITPLNADGSLSVNIEENNNDITTVKYEVYSLDGKDKYTEGEAEVPGEEEAVNLRLGSAISGDVREAVLKIILTVGDDSVSYYTRVAMPTDLATSRCLEYALDFLRFCGSEEGQRVQGMSGAAIPAYIGLEDTWIQAFDKFDADLSVEHCVEMFDYGVQSVNNASRPNWKTQVSDTLLKIYSGELTLDEGLNEMQRLVDEAKAP